MAGLTKILDIHNIRIEDHDIFVETGLYMGDTFIGLFDSGVFQKIEKGYSVELSKDFVDRALAKRPAIEGSNAQIVHGDSGSALSKITKDHSDKRILFWLDSHYSGGPTAKSEEFGECPIMGEIKSLENLSQKPTIIIDDLGAFQKGTQYYLNGWPTLDEVIEESKKYFNFDVFIGERDDSNKLHYAILS